MTLALVGVLALAVWMALSPTRGPSRRLRMRLALPPTKAVRGYANPHPGPGGRPWAGPALGHEGAPRGGMLSVPGLRAMHPLRWTQPGPTFVPMALLVQQSAALLRGGRAPARLWDELWLLYGVEPPPGPSASDVSPAILAPAARASLAAARTAAKCGAPVGEAIRRAVTLRVARAAPGSRAVGRERGAWMEFAVCFDVAEASGCPLADVLTRFAAQLEAEEDAEAARQTALAGPRATVRLLGWLPVLGLGLGMMLGVDPLNILLGEPTGLAALAAGVALTAAGRIWSARLVRSAAGHTK